MQNLVLRSEQPETDRRLNGLLKGSLDKADSFFKNASEKEFERQIA
jgi:hypothetical protein